jgi:hypothetical protein
MLLAAFNILRRRRCNRRIGSLSLTENIHLIVPMAENKTNKSDATNIMGSQQPISKLSIIFLKNGVLWTQMHGSRHVRCVEQQKHPTATRELHFDEICRKSIRRRTKQTMILCKPRKSTRLLVKTTLLVTDCPEDRWAAK